MIDQDIPEFTSDPDRDNQSQEVFSSHIGTRMKEEKILIPILNIWAQQANQTATDINSDKLAVDTATTATLQASNEAVAARDAAFASTATEYDTGRVGGYGFGNVVYENGGLYMAIQAQAEDAVQPLTDAAYWLSMRKSRETIYIEAGSMDPRETNGARLIKTETPTNKLNSPVLVLEKATEQGAQVSFPMPDRWDQGTVKAKLYWTPPVGASPGDVIELGIRAVSIANGETLDAALGTTIYVTDTVIQPGYEHVTPVSAAITIGGTLGKGNRIYWEVYRKIDGSDTMAEDLYLESVHIQCCLAGYDEDWA